MSGLPATLVERFRAGFARGRYRVDVAGWTRVEVLSPTTFRVDGGPVQSFAGPLEGQRMVRLDWPARPIAMPPVEFVSEEAAAEPTGALLGDTWRRGGQLLVLTERGWERTS